MGEMVHGYYSTVSSLHTSLHMKINQFENDVHRFTWFLKQYTCVMYNGPTDIKSDINDTQIILCNL
jgi:hypothetical protein